MSHDMLLREIDPIIEAQARSIAWMCQRFYSSGEGLDWQALAEDLAQAARIYLWQYIERRGNPGPSLLLVLGRLRMYAERSRGRSVLRAHPGKRKRSYERATLDQADACISIELEPYPALSDEQERDLLLSMLHLAQAEADHQIEHVALLALRRLARALEDSDLVDDCNAQLRAWWRRHRQQAEEVLS
jgi:hypothetical protein